MNATDATERISDYLTTGMHHSTPDGKAAISAIVDEAIRARVSELEAAVEELIVECESVAEQQEMRDDSWMPTVEKARRILAGETRK